MTALDLLILAACTWRLARLLSQEDGPYNILTRFRARFPLGGLWECIYCISCWVAPAAYLVYQSPARALVIIGAISGLAMLMHRYTGGNFT